MDEVEKLAQWLDWRASAYNFDGTPKENAVAWADILDEREAALRKMAADILSGVWREQVTNSQRAEP